MRRRLALIAMLAAALAYGTGCGGSAASAPAAAPTVRAAVLTITTDSNLPGTLQGHAYTATLAAMNGQGALHWSISPNGGLGFVTGLSVDASTGVLSGVANFAGPAAFVAQVTDSGSPPQTVSKVFNLTTYGPLAANATRTMSLTQYGNGVVPPSISGGVPPLHFAVSAGTLPRGTKVDSNTGQIFGAPLDLATYQFVLTAQDSFSPVETVSQQITITVTPPFLTVPNSIPSKMLLNRPFTGRVYAIGGVPPYKLTLGGTLPPGITFDPVTGAVAGTPTTAGSYTFGVNAADSDTPARTAGNNFAVLVAPPLGRNDSPTTATTMTNGITEATISPYIDPPNGVPAPGDGDFYKIVSLGGALVHLETLAKRLTPDNPLDTVIQVTDGNGAQFSSCRQPANTTGNFTSPCVNDDMSATVQDSALDFQVPGSATTPTTFYVQVLDFRGDARPDMVYMLQVSGALPPP
jgi:hypothetical protein